MPPFKVSQKRRRSSETTATQRNVRSRTVSHAGSSQSNVRSVSRHSDVSRTPSTDSPNVPGRRQARRPEPTDRSTPSISRRSSRTLVGDEAGEDIRPPVDDIDQDLDALNEIVMAVDLGHRGSVGCSYYVAREEKLYFMEEVQLGGPQVLDSCEY